MAACPRALLRPLLLLRPARPSPSPVCSRCRRSLATSPSLLSGHNKWSKIKHTKGAEDARRSLVRAQLSKNLSLYSKLYGASPDNNPQLVTAIAAAKKAGVPKNVIEQAIARGQGRSTSGASLEAMTFEVMVPPSVALILDVETDNRQRALQDLNQVVKKHGARGGGTEFLFSKTGRVVFEAAGAGEAGEGGAAAASPPVGAEEIMDEAIEAGAEDIETDEDGNVVVLSRPADTMQIARAVGGKFGLRLLSSDIIWAAREETQARIDGPADLRRIADLVAALREVPDVQAVYANAARGDVSEEEWARLDDNLDA